MWLTITSDNLIVDETKKCVGYVHEGEITVITECAEAAKKVVGKDVAICSADDLLRRLQNA